MKRILYWSSRILILLLAAFFLLMGLDVFAMPGTLPERIVGYFMHSIPALLLLLLLVLVKKSPKYAGLVCMLLVVFGFSFFNTYRNVMAFLIVTVLPLLVGIEFLYESKRK